MLMQTLMLPRLPRGATQIIPLALHAGLSTEEQLRVFNAAERGTRKVIAATNIAEVSRPIFGNLASYDAIRPASLSMG
jgi:ATP-dependent RNA helicase DDX35